jgi:hypothetical protein
MKKFFVQLCILISGKESPTNENIDVFLRPLVDDLKLLWNGVGAQDFLQPVGKRREKLVRERGAGSGEQGFHLQFFWNFQLHGEADLLPWIINVYTFIK